MCACIHIYIHTYIHTYGASFQGHVLTSEERRDLCAIASILHMQHSQQAKILLPPEGSYVAGSVCMCVSVFFVVKTCIRARKPRSSFPLRAAITNNICIVHIHIHKYTHVHRKANGRTCGSCRRHVPWKHHRRAGVCIYMRVYVHMLCARLCICVQVFISLSLSLSVCVYV